MSLDIRFKEVTSVICPHCCMHIRDDVAFELQSGGHGWRPFLASIGYYVPYDERTEENDWYAKDMKLTKDQTQEAYEFLKKNNELYDANEIRCMIAESILNGSQIVVNADW